MLRQTLRQYVRMEKQNSITHAFRSICQDRDLNHHQANKLQLLQRLLVPPHRRRKSHILPIQVRSCFQRRKSQMSPETQIRNANQKRKSETQIPNAPKVKSEKRKSQISHSSQKLKSETEVGPALPCHGEITPIHVRPRPSRRKRRFERS